MFEEIYNGTARQRFANIGMSWVRLYIGWRYIESSNSNPPSYNWASVDDLVRQAQAAGLQPYFTVQDPPDWAASIPCGPIDKVPPSRFAAFMTALAQRYDGDGYNDFPELRQPVRYYELWNEPDYDRSPAPGGCWGGDVNQNGTPDPEEYATMLQAVYPAVKAAAPQVQLVFGSIAYDTFTGSHFNMTFTDQVLGALSRDPAAATHNFYFDVMAFHQYDAFRRNWDGTLPYYQGLLGKASAVDNLLTRYGLQKPLIVSEAGLQIGNNPGSATAEDLEAQARHLARVFTQSKAAEFPVVIWYTAIDRPDELRYGLFGTSFNDQRPAFTAAQVAIRQLQGMNFDQQLDTDITGDPRIQAFRFIVPGGQRRLVVWADNGQRIKDTQEVDLSMTVTANTLGVSGAAWTGRVRVTNQYGISQIYGSGGTQVIIPINRAVVYLEVA